MAPGRYAGEGFDDARFDRDRAQPLGVQEAIAWGLVDKSSATATAAWANRPVIAGSTTWAVPSRATRQRPAIFAEIWLKIGS
jgi:hypothetical protein